MITGVFYRLIRIGKQKDDAADNEKANKQQ